MSRRAGEGMDGGQHVSQKRKNILAQEFRTMDFETHFHALIPANKEVDAHIIDNEPKIAKIEYEFNNLKQNLSKTKQRKSIWNQSPWAGNLNQFNII